MNSLDRQFQDLASLLASPLGVAGVLLLIAAAIGAGFSARLRWGVLVMLLLSTTFSIPTFSAARLAADPTAYRPLMFPFEGIRNETRIISGAMVCILLLPAFLIPLGWRKTAVPLSVVAYLVFQLSFSFIGLVADPSLKTFLSLPLFIITFLSIGVGINKALQSERDVYVTLWALIATFGLMVLAIAVQLAGGDPKAMFLNNNRFQGMTANPQFFAVIAAPAILIVLYLLLDKRPSKVAKAGLGLLAAALAVFLFWTGSRTGMLMMAIGLLLFFRLRLGRLMLAGGVIAVCVLGVLQFFGDRGSDQSGRYLSMQDTRSYVWRRQWATFTENPLLGATAAEDDVAAGNGENSYLTVAASYGIVGLIPLFLMLMAMAWDFSRTWRVRSVLPEYVMLIDLVIAIFAMVVAGAWFEVYLLGQFNLIVLILFIASCISAYLRDLAAERVTEAAMIEHAGSVMERPLVSV